MTREAEIQARLDAAHDTPWQPYFNIHADPFVVSDPDRPITTTVATVSTHPSDYGRANALLLGNAPDDISYLLARNKFLLDRIKDIANITEKTNDVDVFTAREHEYARHLLSLIEKIDDVILDNFTDEELT